MGHAVVRHDRGRRENEHAARPHQLVQVAQHDNGLRHVLHHLRAQHQIERAAREEGRQRPREVDAPEEGGALSAPERASYPREALLLRDGLVDQDVGARALIVLRELDVVPLDADAAVCRCAMIALEPTHEGPHLILQPVDGTSHDTPVGTHARAKCQRQLAGRMERSLHAQERSLRTTPPACKLLGGSLMAACPQRRAERVQFFLCQADALEDRLKR
mmetsp:Transcript_11711/g.27538  ORF Transcript_11711/g.27538 Transcript_11711/m.27538 type:complete len:218 (+) Transcript_11711:785-1438(+)